MVMNRKSIFYTLIAILLVAFFIVSFTMVIKYRESFRMEIVKTRVHTMNDFVSSIETDMERALYISGYRAIISLNRYVTSNQSNYSYLSDTESAFREMIINGTLNGTIIDILMENQTILDWAAKIEGLGQSIALATNLDVGSVTIAHATPWTLRVTADVNFTIEDARQTAVFKRSNQMEAAIPVQNLEDPMYVIESPFQLFHRTIRPTNFTSWNITNLRYHLLNKTYVANTDAPSFLMRMEEKFTSSPYGIETLVDTYDLEVQDPYSTYQFVNTSSVDYLYWQGAYINNSRIQTISDDGDHDDFRLDTAHIQFYNVEAFAYP